MVTLFSGSKFRNNFLAVARANVFAQFLVLLATPLLTRLYTPESFGVLALYLSVVQLAGACCTLKFESLLPNSELDESAKKLISSGLKILLLFISLSWVVIFLINLFHIENRIFNTLDPFLYTLPIAFFFTGMYQLLKGWFTRESDLTPISKARLAQSIAYLTVALVLGVFLDGAIGLIFGQIAALIIACIVAGVVNNGVFTQIKPSKLITRVSHTKFIWIQAATASGTTLLNTISFNLPVFVLAFAYSSVEVGFYSLMLRLVATPLGAITSALSLSFWARAAELKRAGDYPKMYRLFLKLVGVLFGASLLIAIACFIGSFFIVPILGSNWDGASTVLLVLVPMLMGMTVMSASNHLIVLEKQYLQFYADGFRIMSILIIGYFSVQLEMSFINTVLLISICSSIAHAILFAVNVHAHKNIANHARTTSQM